LGVHPGASKKSKAWDPERFSMVIDKITDDYDIKVIIFYGINERETAEMLVRKSNSSNVLIGPETKSIRELAAMMTKCNLFFCNNSGPMNLAVSLGIPTVALLGSTHPMDWGPYGKNHVSIKSPLYLNSFTENDELAAMKAIRTDKVLDILRKKISELSTNK
jgi:ADP-heptose:LPS heptosyltransferase